MASLRRRLWITTVDPAVRMAVAHHRRSVGRDRSRSQPQIGEHLVGGRPAELYLARPAFRHGGFRVAGQAEFGLAIGKFPHSPLEVVGRGRAWMLAWELGSVVSC